MKRRIRLFEGKSKIRFKGTDPHTNILFFKDEISDIAAANREILDGKGVLRNRISEHLFTALKCIAIPNHFIKRLNMREQLVKEVEIIPIKCVIRNSAIGSFAERFNLKVGSTLNQPILEFFYKKGNSSTLVSEEHITSFGWASASELDDIIQYSMRINDFLTGYFLGIDFRLLDFKIKFGRLSTEHFVQIILSDELSPENIRLFDLKNNNYIPDQTKTNHHKQIDNYKNIAERMGLLLDQEKRKSFTPYIVS